MNNSRAEASSGQWVLQQAVRLAWNKSPAAISESVGPRLRSRHGRCGAASSPGPGWGWGLDRQLVQLLLQHVEFLFVAGFGPELLLLQVAQQRIVTRHQRLAMASDDQGLVGSHQAAAS